MSDRNVVLVIKEIQPFIPQDETKLISEIQIYKDSLWNQAPERLKTSDCWLPFINILNNNIINVDTEWKRKLVSIINNS